MYWNKKKVSVVCLFGYVDVNVIRIGSRMVIVMMLFDIVLIMCI